MNKINIKSTLRCLRPIIWRIYLLALLLIVLCVLYISNKQLEIVNNMYNLTIQKSNNSCQILARNTLNTEVLKFKKKKITDKEKEFVFNRFLKECLFANGLTFNEEEEEEFKDKDKKNNKNKDEKKKNNK